MRDRSSCQGQTQAGSIRRLCDHPSKEPCSSPLVTLAYDNVLYHAVAGIGRQSWHSAAIRKERYGVTQRSSDEQRVTMPPRTTSAGPPYARVPGAWKRGRGMAAPGTTRRDGADPNRSRSLVDFSVRSAPAGVNSTAADGSPPGSNAGVDGGSNEITAPTAGWDRPQTKVSGSEQEYHADPQRLPSG